MNAKAKNKQYIGIPVHSPVMDNGNPLTNRVVASAPHVTPLKKIKINLIKIEKKFLSMFTQIFDPRIVLNTRNNKKNFIKRKKFFRKLLQPFFLLYLKNKSPLVHNMSRVNRLELITSTLVRFRAGPP